MEVKNKNIFLNLNESEDILYVGQKDMASFYISFAVIIMICIGLIFLLAKLFLTQNVSILILNYPIFKFIILGMLLFIFLLDCILYKYFLDYFFTDVVLTNQRLLLSKNNNIISVKYENINRISNCLWKGPQGILINSNVGLTSFFNPLFTTSNKQHIVYFINYEAISNKINEISPNKADIVRKMTLQDVLIIVLVLILFFVVKLFLYK